jgi:hypothetical protein
VVFSSGQTELSHENLLRQRIVPVRTYANCTGFLVIGRAPVLIVVAKPAQIVPFGVMKGVKKLMAEYHHAREAGWTIVEIRTVREGIVIDDARRASTRSEGHDAGSAPLANRDAHSWHGVVVRGERSGSVIVGPCHVPNQDVSPARCNRVEPAQDHGSRPQG